MKDYLEDVAKDVTKSNDEQLLETLYKSWDDHQQTMKMVRDILVHGSHLRDAAEGQAAHLRPRAGDLPGHHRLAPAGEDRLRRIILQGISKERSGQQVDRMLSGTASMLADLGVNKLDVYEEASSSTSWSRLLPPGVDGLHQLQHVPGLPDQGGGAAERGDAA